METGTSTVQPECQPAPETETTPQIGKIPLEQRYHNVKLLGCGHAFHVDCISGWENSSVRCPVCREVQVQVAEGANVNLNPITEGAEARGGDVRAEAQAQPHNDGGLGTANQDGEPQHNAQLAAYDYRYNAALRNNDYNFRMNRLRHYYPNFISGNMVTAWTQPGYVGNPLTEVDFIRSQPGVGGGGGVAGGNGGIGGGDGGGGWSVSGGSFGGGSSFGGGGAGSSW